MKYGNLPKGFEYGEIYSSREVHGCGNRSVHPEGNKRFRLESIRIKLLEERIHENRHMGWAFKSRFSQELRDGAGRGKHSSQMEISKRMDDYRNGWPVPPIVIDGTRIGDGNHRLYALYKLGYRKADAFVEVKD